jgi:hypothetical protein
MDARPGMEKDTSPVHVLSRQLERRTRLVRHHAARQLHRLLRNRKQPVHHRRRERRRASRLRLRRAPAGITPFQINTDADDAMATAGVGIDVISANETVLHFAYDGEFGETTQVHAVSLKGSARF